LNNDDLGGGRDNQRAREGLRRTSSLTQRPLVSTKKLVTIVGVFIIPVIAGVLLPFYDATTVGVITVALYASLWLLLNPFQALLLYMVLVAVRPQEGIVQLQVIPVERLCAVLAMLGWGLQVAVGKTMRPISRSIGGWLLAFTAVCFFSIFTSVWKLWAFNAWIEMLKLGVLFFLISQLVDTHKRLFVFLLIFAVGHFWMAAESLRLYYSEGYDYTAMGIVRATTGSASRGDPNSLAASLVLCICFGLYTFRASRNFFLRLSWAGAICVGSVVVILTGSRAAMLGFLFLLLYMWLTSRKKLLTGTIIAIILVCARFTMPLQYRERFMTTFDFKKNPSATESAMGRIEGLKVGTKMFLDRPLLGVGVGNFGVAHGMLYSPPRERSWMEAHNVIAQIGGETGILGLITFTGFLIACMRGAARARSMLSSVDTAEAKGIVAVCRACMAAFWLLLVLGQFGHNMMRYNWYLNAGLVSACLIMASSTLRPTSHDR
jgi:O-antigen ligase